MRRNNRTEGPPTDYLVDEGASDDDDWNMGEEADDDDDDEIHSMASSVPTTVNSATDERTSPSVLAQKRRAQRVFSAKLMIMGLFLIVTVAVSATIYGFASKEENNLFMIEVRSSLINMLENALWMSTTNALMIL